MIKVYELASARENVKHNLERIHEMEELSSKISDKIGTRSNYGLRYHAETALNAITIGILKEICGEYQKAGYTASIVENDSTGIATLKIEW